MDRLILDTLFPPPPAQLIDDLNAVGADGAAVYVWRPGGVGTWTPGHVTALRAAGKIAFPIIVPQSDGGDINGMLGAAQSFGFTSGPITIDAEFPNLPPASWEEAFDRAAAANGFSDFDYGTPHDLGLYQPDNQNWVAEWLRTGVLQPLPPLPADRSGWQFVNDVPINGRSYDASVIASSVFREENMDPEDVQRIKDIWNFLYWGTADTSVDRTNPPIAPPWIKTAMDAIAAKVQAPASVDVQALVTSLEPLLAAELIQHIPPSVDPQTVARAVLSALVTQLSKP